MKNQQYHYLCLIEELRKRLQNGQLHAGDVLPSEQEWAEALSIKKRDVRPILKNLEMTGVLSCSKEGEMTLSKDMSDSMEELLHVMFLIQKFHPMRCVRCGGQWSCRHFLWYLPDGNGWIWTN